MALQVEQAEISHRSLKTNGIQMHIAECGTGPLVLLLHGFPEFWYSWRKQLGAIAKAGFHAVAPDLRGVGSTDAPESPTEYTILHQVGDVIGLIDALGEKKAFVVGHDWGSYLAWHVGLFRPDRVAGVVAMSVPYVPRNPLGDMITHMRSVVGDGFYMHHFQTREGAEDEWASFGLDKAFKALLLGTFPKGGLVPPGETFVGQGCPPNDFPPYFSEEDLKAYVDNFSKTGMTGSFNYYRHVRLSWELTAPWVGAIYPASVPVLFIAGEEDGVIKFPGIAALLSNMKSVVPGIDKVVMVKDAAHFLQWQKPDEVNKELIEFLSKINAGGEADPEAGQSKI